MPRLFPKIEVSIYLFIGGNSKLYQRKANGASTGPGVEEWNGRDNVLTPAKPRCPSGESTGRLSVGSGVQRNGAR